MSKGLAIARGVELPRNAVTQTFGFLGRKGSGKTYCSGKLVELLLEIGAQVVILDPVGTWYGLRLSADGKSPGIEIPTFGGEHGDIPIEHTGGAVIADAIVNNDTSAIIDVSHFRKGQRKVFVTDFAEQLFHLKKSRRSPLFLVLEEAQVFAPQRTAKGEERMLGAIEDIVRLGRNYGLGAALLSQRPQSVNKEVLNQVEALFVFQINGPQERKAIESWVVHKGIDAREMVDALPSLEVGHAFLWSPQWLRILKKVHINKKKTFDASSTPTLGARTIKPKKLKPIDLKNIQKDMEETIERMKADDPKVLKKEIIALNRTIQRLDQTKAPVAAPEPMLTDGQFVEIREIIGELGTLKKELTETQGILQSDVLSISELVDTVTGRLSVFDEIVRVSEGRASRRPIVNTQPARALSTIASSESHLPKPQQKIIDSLAALDGIGIDRANKVTLAVYAGVSSRSSGYTNNLGRLRSAGLIEYPTQGDVCLTEEGRQLIGVVEYFTNLNDLHQRWYRMLPRPQQSILRKLIEIYPEQIRKTDLAENVSVSSLSSGYTNNLGKLRSLGAISYPRPGYIVATDMLYPDGLK